MAMTTMMRAVAVDEFGPAANLKPTKLPVREPRDGEVLIRVAAAAVNPADIGMREGRYRWYEPVRFPIVPDYDVAGTVEVGALGWPVGSAVIANTAHARTQVGGYAEYVTLPARYVAPAPSRLDWAHAASIPLAGLTAWQALEALDLSAGQTLLVNGSHGAVGGFAVQLAARVGIEVVAHGPVDAALDVIGGRPAKATFEAVRDRGRYATVVPEFWIPGGQFEPARGIDPVVVLVEPDGEHLTELSRLAGAGELRTRVAQRLPLERAAEAHTMLTAGGRRGKIILTP